MIVNSTFSPAWWARGPHCQTLYPVLLRPRPRPSIRRERLELPDGDFLDLIWSGGGHGPLVVLLHGLEGSIHSKYAAGQMKAIEDAGLRAVLMHFRGCSGEPNRLRRGYHSGETEDIEAFVGVLREREPMTPLAVIGYSLGGNVLLKWLGERGAGAPIDTAVAVSVPFRLGDCADAIGRGFSRIYQRHLMGRMVASYRRKFASRDDAPFDLERARSLTTFREFDEAVTAPLHGYAGAADYYARASSASFLRDIRVPTLVLHALDDPFMTPAATPHENELSPAVRLELCRHGGHVGFIAGRWPWRPRYWLEERIMTHLGENLSRAGAPPP
jgi:uncharacterized protein